jgi:hypothetical protein
MFRCALVALATERYRMRYSHWPDTLDALVPEFLDEPPVDPFDEKPLRYLRDEEGVIVYSVGEDGVDDGGEVRRQSGSRIAAPDVGFRFFDPELRGFEIIEEESPEP